MNRLEYPVTSRRAVAERCVLALFYGHFVAAVALSLIFLEILCADLLFLGALSYLPLELLPQGLLGLASIPVSVWFRHFGVRHFHFLEHEAILDQGLESELSRPDWLVSAGDAPYAVIRDLVEAINTADVWDRPAARAAAKAWIGKNHALLDADDLVYLRSHVPYLLPADSAS